MSDALFAEFPPTSTAEWETAIARDLKGADYVKTLVRRSAEGSTVKPYYRAEDVAGLDWLSAAPGVFPYARGIHAHGGWRIREAIDMADPMEANRAARAAVAAGAEEIAFGQLTLGNASDLALLLSGLDRIPVYLFCRDERLLRRVLQFVKKTPRGAPVSTGFDPLTNLDAAAEIAAASPEGFVPFTIDGARMDDAGANAAQQIGFTLAAGIDYLGALEERGVAAARAAALVEFSFRAGATFFFAIAKLRAFRMLWARVVESFGAPPESARARIAASTARWNKTVYDPHVNILRVTTEAMAAVLGGANSISVAAFDDCYRQPDETTRRLARNTQIMLKKEAMLAHVADPGGGAYALESITGMLADEAWKRMQEIESLSGYRRLQSWINESIAFALAVREKGVEARRRVFVGTSQFANPQEKALPRVEAARMKVLRRGTQAYEELRLRTERHGAAGGKIPRMLLAQIGDAKMRRARAMFSANFFACAGFEVPSRRFNSVDEILTNAADAIVLCSSDPEYAALVAELMPKLKAAGRATPVIVAGNPENAEELTAAGVAEFVHLRSLPLEVLARWQRRFGIKES